MAKPNTRGFRAALVVTAGGAVLLATFVALAAAFPATAAAFCHACYGFQSVGSRLFIERGASAEAKAAVQRTVAEGQERVRGFYGDIRSNPRILVCISEECYRALKGGRSKGMALLTTALVLSPRGTDAVIAAHELSHIELHTRLGLLQTWRRDIPQWFDEGVAVLVSNDPRYVAAPDDEHCLASTDEALPVPATPGSKPQPANNSTPRPRVASAGG